MRIYFKFVHILKVSVNNNSEIKNKKIGNIIILIIIMKKINHRLGKK